jgi:hypothetical protein
MNLSINNWKEDVGLLKEFCIHTDDILYMKDGYLRLIQSESPRNSAMALQPVRVADYLDFLIRNYARSIFQSFRDSNREETATNYEQVAGFKRELHVLVIRLSDFERSFQERDSKEVWKRYNQLCSEAYNLSKEVKEYKSSLKKPPLSERTIRCVDYNARTDVRFFKWKHSNTVSVDSTVKAARKALALSQEQSPIAPSGFFAWGNKDTDRHMVAFKKFVHQLTYTPVITKKFVEAIIELSPHIETLDLKGAVLASQDIMELAPFITEDKSPVAIPLSFYLTYMKKLCEKKHMNLQTLFSVEVGYKRHNELYQIQGIEATTGSFLDRITSIREVGELELIKPHVINPYISPSCLIELLMAASASSKCHEIILSSSIAKHASFTNLLDQYSFKVKEDNDEFKRVYSRRL